MPHSCSGVCFPLFRYQELDEATGWRLSSPASGGARGGGGGDADGARRGGGGGGSGATFLDLGCAPGGFSLHLLGRGLRGVGVTLRPEPVSLQEGRGMQENSKRSMTMFCWCQASSIAPPNTHIHSLCRVSSFFISFGLHFVASQGFHAMDRRLDRESPGPNAHAVLPPTHPACVPAGAGGDSASEGGVISSNGDGPTAKVWPASGDAWTLHYADLTDQPHATEFQLPRATLDMQVGRSTGESVGCEDSSSSSGSGGTANLFDVVIAGARFSKSGKADDEGGGGTRAVAHLLTAQLLLALRHLKEGGNLVLVSAHR